MSSLLLTACTSTVSSPGAVALEDIGTGEPRIRLLEIVGADSKGAGSVLARLVSGQKRGHTLHRPFGVSWQGPDLLVTDPAARRVTRLRPRGRATHSSRELFVSPIGIAACDQGILVTDSVLGKVALLDEDLKLLRWLAEGLERPTGVDCDGDRWFVAETGRHRIVAVENADKGGPSAGATYDRLFRDAPADDPVTLNLTQRAVRILGGRGDGESEFNFPTVVHAGHGLLHVGDSLNFRVQQFDLETGDFLDTFGQLGDSPGEMPRIKGLAVDGQGNVWISDAFLDQVALYRIDGEFLTAMGGNGPEPGLFSFPAGVAAHLDGRIAVVDSLNRRVQIFRLER